LPPCEAVTLSSSRSWNASLVRLRDARDIADELTAKGVALSLGGSRYDPTDPIGRLLFNVLGMVAGSSEI
jgi:DNA invertase Pin-like site-specific DNA recombinase